MVQILPRFDPGGEIGRSFGSGLGKGLEDVTNRRMLRSGINEIQDRLKGLREPLKDEQGQYILDEKGQQTFKQIDPLNVILDLQKTIGTLPGGLQALSDLSGPLLQAVSSSNVQRKLEQDLQKRQRGQKGGSSRQPSEQVDFSVTETPEGSREIIEGEEAVDEARFPEKKGSPQLESVYDQWTREYLENYQATNDPVKARELTNDKLTYTTAEERRRSEVAQNTENALSMKISQSFPDGLSAPFRSDVSAKFFEEIRNGKEPNQAWENLYPDVRAAQTAEENLKNNVGSNRTLFSGGLKERMEKARAAISPIAKIDPEYAISLAEKDLGYGKAEASKIVRPETKNYRDFLRNTKEAPPVYSKEYFQQNIKDKKKGDLLKNEKFYNQWKETTSKNLKKFLKEKFDTNTDSLLALRADLYDKGFPIDSFLEAVNEVFPKPENNPNLSPFNRHEYPNLGSPVVPGMQDIFNNILKNFGATVDESLEKRIRGKR